MFWTSDWEASWTLQFYPFYAFLQRRGGRALCPPGLRPRDGPRIGDVGVLGAIFLSSGGQSLGTLWCE